MAQYSRKLKKGIRWWYKFGYQGKTYISDCIYLSKAEAKKEEAIKMKEIDEIARNPNKSSEMTLIELMDKRLDYLKVKKSVSYYKANKVYFQILLRFFKNSEYMSASSILKKDIGSLLMRTSVSLQKEEKDNYSVNAMLRSYKSLFNYGIQQLDLNMTNPCIGISLYPVNKKLKYIPTDSEIRAVMELCDTEQKILIEFVKETACRISEALRLKDTDIDGDDIILYTRKSKNSNLTPRRVPKPACLDSLIPLKANYRVFSRWSSAPKFLEKKIKELNLHRKWNWHNLRHRRASIWSKEKKPLFEIMLLLGHNNLSTTQNYLQLIGSYSGYDLATN
jgi:integrase